MGKRNNLNNDPIRVTVSLQEKNGKYYAVMQYKDINGKKQYEWKATKQNAEKGTKRIAQRIAEELRHQREQELNSQEEQKENILFGDYLLQWLEKQKSQVELTTFSGYERNTKRTAEYFNDLGMTLQELRTSHLEKYYDTLLQTEYRGKTLKWNTVKRYHANIHKALEDAIRLELLDNNPASHIQHRKVEQYIAGHYNARELKSLFEIAKGELIEPVIIMTAYYGLRKQETLGLKWDAIDFENHTITIKHTVTNASVGGKRVLVKKERTKSKSSYRTLPLIPEMEDLLLKQQAYQEENKEYFGKGFKNKDNYIFVDEEGQLIKPDRVTRRFKKLLEDNNLKAIRFHDLRHSCATLLLAKGVALEDIQVWLGHSTIKTTEIYANNIVLDKVKSADTIALALKASA